MLAVLFSPVLPRPSSSSSCSFILLLLLRVTDKRKSEAERIRAKYPDRIPVRVSHCCRNYMREECLHPEHGGSPTAVSVVVSLPTDCLALHITRTLNKMLKESAV